ncbi:hypothetical protein D3C76_952640 [compost metagenome]
MEVPLELKNHTFAGHSAGYASGIHGGFKARIYQAQFFRARHNSAELFTQQPMLIRFVLLKKAL